MKGKPLHRRAIRGVIGLLVVASALSLAPVARSQYTVNFQTNIISGVTSNWSGTYYVGYTNFADVLLVQNTGELSNGDGYLGYGAGSSNNSARVTGPGSLWSNSGTLTVGYGSTSNTLTISGGGQVLSGSGFVGVGVGSGSSNNSVLVSDVGSVWSNSGTITIGNNHGYGGSLVISNGAHVTSAAGYVCGPFDFSVSNAVLVIGTGSVWSNSRTLAVGGSPNSGVSCSQLVVANGGLATSASGIIGNGVSGNRALVTDMGSAWNDTGSLTVGNGGFLSGSYGNSLVISNGGQVVDTTAYVGNNSFSSNNSARVAGGGVWQNNVLYIGYQGSSNSLLVSGGSVSATNLVIGFASPVCNNLLQLDSGTVVVTNTAHNATLEVRSGALVVNGGALQADRLVITNACALLVHAGGTLIVGSVVLDPNAFRITAVAQEGNNVRVTYLMGPGATNALQAASGAAGGGYSTNGFSDIFVVTNNAVAGTVTNYLDAGAATNVPARYYRVRLVP